MLDRARVIGIVNVTPDSFFDESRCIDAQEACVAACAMVEAGAAALDIGGESTRPGAQRVTAEEQISRIVPVIRAIRDASVAVPISIDTTLVEVARAAIDAGAEIINDVSAGRDSPEMFALASERGVGLILMHRLRPPDADVYSNAYQNAPVYENGVVQEVCDFLKERAAIAIAAGVSRDALVLDPGLGFGKTVEQNHELIKNMSSILALGFPVLGAVSRKSFVGISRSTDHPITVGDRLEASVDLALVMARAGVRLFRVHDVVGHVRAFSGQDRGKNSAALSRELGRE